MKTFDTINTIAARMGAGVLALLVLLVVYDAMMRYLFQSGSTALQELEWHLFDVVILLGIGYTLQRDLHVRVDIFFEHFSERTKAWVDVAGIVLFVIPFSLLIIMIGFEFVMQSFEQLEASSDPGGLPYRFIVKSLMPISMGLLLIQSFSELIKRIERIRK